jgi:hypothetical protein
MSYIRCLSNPERLYIWGDRDGRVTFSHGVKPPLALSSRDSNGFQVPESAFKEVCRKWAEGSEHATTKGFRAKLVHVLLETGKPTPPHFNPFRDERRAEFLVRVSYKRKFVHLWLVTWMHVVHNVMSRSPAHRRTKSKE